VPATEPNGRGYAFVVLKGTFALRKQRQGVEPAIADEQLPLCYGDETTGTPESSSIRFASDMLPPKPCTDVVMVGHAHAPRATTTLDVTLTVGRLSKMVRVFGDRAFYRTMGRTEISAPAQFTSMPLVYERAFGGKDGSLFEERNPVGAGFVAPGNDDVDGRRLPNLEDPRQLLVRPGDRPPPGGFGFISPSWWWRRQYAGTYDERWRREQCPMQPLDFDPRFYHAAHPELISPSPLRGGEMVSATNARPGGAELSFRLPSPQLSATSIVKRVRQAAPFRLSTVLIDADAMLLLLTWTATIECGRELLMVERVTIESEGGMRAA
jgi:hypothetical protein